MDAQLLIQRRAVVGGKDLANWESHEAIEETIRRNTPAVADELHLSESIVRKWKERPSTSTDPDQSGVRNPLDRVERIIRSIQRIDPSRAFVPILWLNARFDFLPPIKRPSLNLTDEELLAAVLKLNREFGQTCGAISAAMKDGRIKAAEYKQCLREAMEQMASLLELLAMMKERVE